MGATSVIDVKNVEEHFDQELARNLASRQRLKNSSVEKLFSRKQMEQGFLECFELIGGVPRLAIWANDPSNYKDFLQLLTKFAPKDTNEQLGRVLEYRSNVPASPLNKGKPEDEGTPRVLEHNPDGE